MELLDTGLRVHVLSGDVASRGESPLASLTRSGLDHRFHAWHGTSGRRHIASVFRVEPHADDAGLPLFDNCIVLPVARHGSRREALGVCVIERGTDRRAALAFAARADEWHVHLLGQDRRDRAVIAADLRARHAPETLAVLSA